MSDIEKLRGELAPILADRFGALGKFFSSIANPEDAGRVLETMIGGDNAAFAALVDRLPLTAPPEWPKLGKCIWLREIIEQTLEEPEIVRGFALKENMNREERFRYLLVLRRCQRSLDTFQTTENPDGRWIVAPGPCLDLLKAEGLVEEVEWKLERVIKVPGQPVLICL